MKTKIILIALITSLLAACGTENPPSTAPTTTPEHAFTGENAPPTPAASPTKSQGNADVTYVRAVLESNGTWTFYVTVAHPDTGWEDYADGWDVVAPDGTVLKPDPNQAFTRELLHPHVDEQPFTRSQEGIAIPEGVSQVKVRAHDIVDGFGGQEVLVDLERSSGPDFDVER